MIKQKENHAEILPFVQPADFFLRKGYTKHENGEMLDALVMFRKAVSLQPDNPENRARLGQIYSDMGCYELSNRVLLSMVWRFEQLPEDYYYNIGCNFIGLQEFDLAIKCFRKYADSLDHVSDSYESDEVMQLLEAIDSDEADLLFFEGDALENGARLLSSHGIELFQKGKTGEAAEYLEQAKDLAPKSAYVLNDIALLYYGLKRYEDALTVCKRALGHEPTNVRANCMHAMILIKTGNTEEAKEALEAANRGIIGEDEENNRYYIAVAYFELGEHKNAKKNFLRVIKERPYDIKSLHGAAANAYMMNEYELAQQYWSRILKLIPDSQTARYYLALAHDAEIGKKKRKAVDLLFELPDEEIARRLQTIDNASQNMKRDKKQNKKLAEYLIWALEYSDRKAQAQAITMLPSVFGDLTEKLLRNYVLRRDTEEILKQEAFKVLSLMGAKEPFYALTNDGLVEIRIDLIKSRNNMPQSYMQVAQKFVTSLSLRNNPQVMKYSLDLWQAFIDEQEDEFIPVANPDSFAAAIEYITKKTMHIKVTQREMGHVYEVSVTKLRYAVMTIEYILPDIIV